MAIWFAGKVGTRPIRFGNCIRRKAGNMTGVRAVHENEENGFTFVKK
ncbi:MAG: hypothetical protein PHR53_02415 [Bacteroidales bacterium]|nr:hypothetical protein [Bacteroidales bacterium]